MCVALYSIFVSLFFQRLAHIKLGVANMNICTLSVKTSSNQKIQPVLPVTKAKNYTITLCACTQR